MSNSNKATVQVIKVGGKIVEDPTALMQLLNQFKKVPGYKVLVHGGGRSATKIAAQMGVETKMVDGRRITDEAMLQVVTMVYGGLVNKGIVSKLQSVGVNAMGITGADMNLIQAHKRPVQDVDYGFVGDIDGVDVSVLSPLLAQGVVPVIAPLTHDGQGTMLNTNADTIASEVAKALAADYQVQLVYCFELPGVMHDPEDDSTVIAEINADSFKQLVTDEIVAGGMIPKLENALKAVEAGVHKVRITKANDLGDAEKGTYIV